MLAARNIDKLNDVATLLEGLGVKTLVTRCDVIDSETVRASLIFSSSAEVELTPCSLVTERDRRGHRGGKNMELLIINFELTGCTEVEYRSICDQIAPSFAAVPGLDSKVWLSDPTNGIYGGVYYFVNAGALDAFLRSELFAQVGAMAQLTNISVRRFGVIDGPTHVTRGVVGASV